MIAWYILAGHEHATERNIISMSRPTKEYEVWVRVFVDSTWKVTVVRVYHSKIISVTYNVPLAVEMYNNSVPSNKVVPRYSISLVLCLTCFADVRYVDLTGWLENKLTDIKDTYERLSLNLIVFWVIKGEFCFRVTDLLRW